MRMENGIRAESFVQGADGALIPFEALTEEQRVRVATELKIRYLNALFGGSAAFHEARHSSPESPV